MLAPRVAVAPAPSRTVRLTAKPPPSAGVKPTEGPVSVKALPSGRVTVQANVSGSAAPPGSAAAALRATGLASVPPAGTAKAVMTGASLTLVTVTGNAF